MTTSNRAVHRAVPRRAVPRRAVLGLVAALAVGACGSPGSSAADGAAAPVGLPTPARAGSTTTVTTRSGPTTTGVAPVGPSTTTPPPTGPTTTTGGATGTGITTTGVTTTGTTTAGPGVGPTVAPGEVMPAGPGRPTPPDAAARAALADARSRWAARPAYTLRIRFTCMCPMGGTWEIRVVDGAAVEVTALETRPFAGSLPEGFRTVEELFGRLDRALGEAEAVAATYDAALGHPVSVDIDSLVQAVDDEVSWRITSLVVD